MSTIRDRLPGTSGPHHGVPAERAPLPRPQRLAGYRRTPETAAGRQAVRIHP